MENSKKDMRYKVCAVKVGNGVVMGYAPNDNYVNVGDEVRVGEFRTYGTVLLVDDFVAYDDMVEWEKLTGFEFQKIMVIYDRNEVKWEED